ncbi:hypothetical protein CHUAL_011387 [Chamberlinius hualienensis]
MSYAQYGYAYHPPPQILVGSQGSSNPLPPNPCCESGRVVTDPVTSQMMFSCQQCDNHSLMPRLGSSVSSTPYATYAPEQSYSTVGMGVEQNAFYSSLTNPYVLKDGSNEVPSGWPGMQTAAYYPAYEASIYGYGSYDVNGARRKNATREATATLKNWLNEHRKNPYPTKGEKIMLAIITKMTLTQVSTWFANARRRLKKENKMTWDNKGKEDDDDDDENKMSEDDDETKDSLSISSDRNQIPINNIKIEAGFSDDKSLDGPKDHSRDGLVGSNGLTLPPSVGSANITHNPLGHMQRLAGPCDSVVTPSITNHSLQPHHALVSHHPSMDPMSYRQQTQPHHILRYPSHPLEIQPDQERLNMDVVGQESDMTLQGAHQRAQQSSSPSQNKPKIWSLADTATGKTSQRSNRSIELSSGFNRLQDVQWQPTPAYQRPISSYQSGQPAPSTNHSYGNLYQQQTPVSAPLALLVNDKSPTSSVSSIAAINPQHSAILNQIPPTGCDVTSSPTTSSIIAPSSIRTAVINQCSNNPFNEIQTDTPPQTPPNHKFPLTSNGGAGVNGAYISRLGGHTAAGTHVGSQGSTYNSTDVYGGQRALVSRMADFQVDDNSEHVANTFPNTLPHVNALSSNNHDNSTNANNSGMEGTAFKPVYKSSLSNSGNLVTA